MKHKNNDFIESQITLQMNNYQEYFIQVNHRI
jgi:hypothetical protein